MGPRCALCPSEMIAEPPLRPRIRAATSEDAPAIAELLGILGYPASSDEVLARLARLDTMDWAVTLVADLDGRAVGVVTGHVFPSIHSTPVVAWLTSLVVSDRHQRQGIGGALTRAIEDWARKQGAIRVSLTSGLQRVAAHAFYQRLGYEHTGLRLTKPLHPGVNAYPVAAEPAKNPSAG